VIDPLPTTHARIYNDVRSGARPDPTPGKRESRLVTISMLLVAALIVGAPIVYFLLHRPAVYEGPIHWGSAYSTITLVNRGITVSVGDDARISIGGEQLNVSDLDPALHPESVARAKVVYWPSVQSRFGGRSVAYATSVVIE